MTLTMSDYETKLLIRRLQHARAALAAADVHGDAVRDYIGRKCFDVEGETAYQAAREAAGRIYSAMQWLDAILESSAEEARHER